MMPDATAPITIRTLAGLEASGPVPPLSDAKRRQLVNNLRDKAREAKALSKLDLGHRLLDALGEAMLDPLAAVLKEYWKQHAELREVAAKKGSERDVHGYVELVDHAWTWKVHPSVTVEVNGVRLETLRFTLATKLSLKGVKLEMRNACITGIEAGTLVAETTLTYDPGGGAGAHFQLAPVIKGKLDLPGEFALPRGGICLG